MKKLASINKYFIKHKWRLLLGILFVTISNYFAVEVPQKVGKILDYVLAEIPIYEKVVDPIAKSILKDQIFAMVFKYGLILLALALLRGVFMYFMRQTIIVMSRHIEYDQKAEIYSHYQKLDTHFFKTHSTGDLMNRMSEDVGRVRMFTGPSIMYAVNLTVLTILCLWNMLKVNALLTLCVIIPLIVLGFTIFFVNKIIYRKSDKIQAELSDLTTTAQEAFSGIRVIKSFVQEKTYFVFLKKILKPIKKVL